MPRFKVTKDGTLRDGRKVRKEEILTIEEADAQADVDQGTLQPMPEGAQQKGA